MIAVRQPDYVFSPDLRSMIDSTEAAIVPRDTERTPREASLASAVIN
jgi:hypothetical protein